MFGSLSYDGLLQPDLPLGVSVVGYADDVAAALATARNASLAEDALNPALELVAGWLARNGLGLATEKTKAYLASRRAHRRSPGLVRVDHSVLGRPSRLVAVLRSPRGGLPSLTKHRTSVGGKKPTTRHGGLWQAAARGRGVGVHRYVGDEQPRRSLSSGPFCGLDQGLQDGLHQ